MQHLRTLIWKEWRDARLLILGAAVLALGLAWTVNWQLLHFQEGLLVAEAMVPGLLGLFLAAVASDLVAADVATNRIAGLALLPCDPRRVWTAKVLFLAVAGAGFWVWLMVTQTALLAAFAVPAALDQFLGRVPDTLPHLTGAMAVGAAVLFFSTLLERGFAAVISGVVVLGAGVAYVVSVNLAFHGVPLSGGLLVATFVVTTSVFVTASGVAFRRGRIHEGDKLRVSALGLLVLFASFTPLGVGAAWAVNSRWAVEPGDELSFVKQMAVSPDGRYVAVQMSHTAFRRAVPWRKWERNEDYSARVWIIDTTTTERLEVAGRATQLLWDDEPWTKKGHLRVWTRPSSSVTQDGHVEPGAATEFRVVDPATGEALSGGPLFRVPHPPRGTGPFGDRTGWATMGTRSRNAGRKTVAVLWKARGLETDVEMWGKKQVIPLADEGVFLFWASETEVRRHDLATGEETTFIDGDKVSGLYGSTDGRRVLTYSENRDGMIALDTRTGQVVGGPWTKCFAQWPSGVPGHRWVLLHEYPGVKVVDLVSGRECVLSNLDQSRPSVAPVPGGGFVVATRGGPIELRDDNGNVVRTLLAGAPEGN